MQYTPEILAEHLGKKYNPDAEYLIETHRGAATRILGGKFKVVGEVPDFSLNEKGTMVVLECVKGDTPVDRSIAAPARGLPGQKSIATAVDQTPPPPAAVVHEEAIQTEPSVEQVAKPEPVKTKPKQADPTVIRKSIHVKSPPPTATDRGGKPLGGKKK